MSKIIWEFDLDEDGVEQEFSNAYNGSSWKFVVWDIDQKLRDLLKYDNDYTSADAALEDIRNELHNIMERWGVNLDEPSSIARRLPLWRRCSIVDWMKRILKSNLGRKHEDNI